MCHDRTIALRFPSRDVDVAGAPSSVQQLYLAAVRFFAACAARRSTSEVGCRCGSAEP